MARPQPPVPRRPPAVHPPPARPQQSRLVAVRPPTWWAAARSVWDELERNWWTQEYYALCENAIAALSGNSILREWVDNETYWTWTAASFVLMLMGQGVLFAAIGQPIRRMAVVFSRRPAVPFVFGMGGVLLGVPMVVGLLYSGIGAPAALFLWAFLYMAAIVGKMGVFLSMGWSISRAFGGRGSTVIPFFFVYVLYGAVVVVDPFGIGKALFLVANALGVGLALRTRFGFGVRAPAAPAP
jgi:hypothetical protein